MLETAGDIENIRIVYQQACENMRYQDDLRWSRFKTISIIEGAFLLALSQFELKPIESFVIAVFGILLVLIVSLLEVKDGYDAKHYYRRSVELEKAMGILPLSFDWFFRSLRGKHLVIAALAVINIFNVFVIIKYSKLIG